MEQRLRGGVSRLCDKLGVQFGHRILERKKSLVPSTIGYIPFEKMKTAGTFAPAARIFH
jgi:hypothetical protein